MCPTDSTPDPRDMLRAPDEPEFLQPAPDPLGRHRGLDADAADGGNAAQGNDPTRAPRAEAPEQRPALPDHPVMTAVDIEDEEADPVGDERPGLRDRLHSDSTLQRE